MPLRYVGSKKHKLWTPGGASGSICPDWTHTVNGRHFGVTEPDMWDNWPNTEAQRLLADSILDGDKRYAASRGIAFCGQITTGDTWHGYPIPWRDVPLDVREQLEDAEQVTSREIKRGIRAQQGVDPKFNQKWALESDGG